MSAAQIPSKTAAETRNAAVSFVGMLDDGELLTGTPTVTVTGLTISNIAINSAALTIDGEQADIGQAVQFKVVGGTAGTMYELVVAVSTDATPAQTFSRSVFLEVT